MWCLKFVFQELCWLLNFKQKFFWGLLPRIFATSNSSGASSSVNSWIHRCPSINKKVLLLIHLVFLSSSLFWFPLSVLEMTGLRQTGFINVRRIAFVSSVVKGQQIGRYNFFPKSVMNYPKPEVSKVHHRGHDFVWSLDHISKKWRKFVSSLWVEIHF